MTDNQSLRRIFRPLADQDNVVQPTFSGTALHGRRTPVHWRNLVIGLLVVVVSGLTGLAGYYTYGTLSRFFGSALGSFSFWSEALLPELEARDVKFYGLRQLDRVTLLRTMAIRQGENILSLDLRVLHQRLMAHPWIKSVYIQRQLGGTLLVDVREYLPAAIEREGETSFLLSADGHRIANIGRERARAVYPDLLRLRGQPSKAAVQRLFSATARFPQWADRLFGADRLALEGWRLWLYRQDGSHYFVTLDDQLVSDATETEKRYALETSLALWLGLEQEYQLSSRDVRGYDLRHYPRILVTSQPVIPPH